MLQAKLLRVVEEQTFRRLGGLIDIHLDLRVVAATNRNLRKAVEERSVPPGPIFPPQRHPDHDSAPSREDRGHPGRWRVSSSSTTIANSSVVSKV